MALCDMNYCFVFVKVTSMDSGHFFVYLYEWGFMLSWIYAKVVLVIDWICEDFGHYD